MANDQSIELRVSLQERQMETVVEIVEEIRTNYVTKTEFREAMAQQRAEFREDQAQQRAEFREDLAQQRAGFSEEMEEQRAVFREAMAQQRAEFSAALAVQRADFKEGLDGLRADMKGYIGELLTHYATKEDLANTITYSRNWVISVGLSLAALQFTMQMVFFQWYTHLR